MKPGELELWNPDTYTRGFPHDYFAMLRREAPVCWHDGPAEEEGRFSVKHGFWAVSRHADVVHVSRTPRLWSSHVAAPFMMDLDADSLAMQQSTMIAMDPPSHVKYRRLVQRGFTPSKVRELEPRIREHAARIVDVVAERGACEFVDELASELPLILICELMGVPQEDRRKVFDWSNRMIGSDDPEYGASNPDDAQQAMTEVYLYAAEQAAQKRGKPDDTLISKMIHGEVEGEKITDHEFNAFMVLAFVAGNETTRNATSQGMRLLSEHPDQYAKLRANPDLLPGAIEEMLRYTPPVMNFRRTATEDTELGGIELPRGAKVVVFYPSANRDEDVFDDPDRFDITRDPNPHLSFGIGEHFCLGANLARMQLQCIFGELLRRVPDLHVSAEPDLLYSNFIDGIKRMPVEFTPERASP